MVLHTSYNVTFSEIQTSKTEVLMWSDYRKPQKLWKANDNCIFLPSNWSNHWYN